MTNQTVGYLWPLSRARTLLVVEFPMTVGMFGPSTSMSSRFDGKWQIAAE